MASVAKVEWTYKGATKTAWVVRYKDAGGVRRQKKCISKKAADAFRLKVENEIEAGEHVPERETMTVSRLCDHFMRNVEDKLKDGRVGWSRFDHLERMTRLHVRKHLGALKLTELTCRRVEEFYSAMLQADRRCSPQTAKSRLENLQLMQDFAIKRGWMAKRPVSEALKELRGIEEPTIRTFTIAEAGQLFRAATARRHKGHRRIASMLECYVHLAAFCGLRFGEITALTRSAVDLDARLLRIRQSMCRFSGVKAPKTRAGVRDVPIPAHVVVLLRDWIEDFYEELPGEILFTTRARLPLKHQQFHTSMWLPLLKRAGLDEGDQFHFHALRHFAASMMVGSRINLSDVAAMLGHAKFDMTLQVYAHPTLENRHRLEAVDRMAASVLLAAPTFDTTAIPAG